MKTSKSVKEIVSIQNSCKDIIQELYSYDSRPNEIIRENYKSNKLDEAINLEIIEHDEYEGVLTLSSDTKDYYKNRLGQTDETNIAAISDTLVKLKQTLQSYNIRLQSAESCEREIYTISKLLGKIPTLLKQNLKAITSNSLFAFKNEPNYEIKMLTLNICNDEIKSLIQASKEVDEFLQTEREFLKSINSVSINSTVIRVKRNSVALESSFRALFEDIKNFINQSIKDGIFIEKLKKLKALKDENKLLQNTNLEELVEKREHIVSAIKEKRLHPDDALHDYMPTIVEILHKRETQITQKRESVKIEYDLDEVRDVNKRLYDYPKLHQSFLTQNDSLATFLQKSEIDKDRLLGIFIRMLKNYSKYYEVESDEFVELGDRMYAKVFSKKRDK